MAFLEVINMDKNFGGLTAVSDSSFHVKEGEILGLIGPNGAGKTTIFDLITGFLKPDNGAIIFKGEEIQGLEPHEICKKRCYSDFSVCADFPPYDNA